MSSSKSMGCCSHSPTVSRRSSPASVAHRAPADLVRARHVEEAHEDVREGGLARAARSDDEHALAGADVEVDALERGTGGPGPVRRHAAQPQALAERAAPNRSAPIVSATSPSGRSAGSEPAMRSAEARTWRHADAAIGTAPNTSNTAIGTRTATASHGPVERRRPRQRARTPRRRRPTRCRRAATRAAVVPACEVVRRVTARRRSASAARCARGSRPSAPYASRTSRLAKWSRTASARRARRGAIARSAREPDAQPHSSDAAPASTRHASRVSAAGHHTNATSTTDAERPPRRR